MLAIFAVLVARGAWGIHQKATITAIERTEAERTLSDLEKRSRELEVSLVSLKSAQGIEAEVRQKFTVARPGEELVVVVDENDKKGKNGEEVLEGGLWAQITRFFGGE